MSTVVTWVVAVVCGLAASTAFLGYFAVHQSSQIAQQNHTIAVQQAQIKQLEQGLNRPAATTAPAVLPSASPSAGDTFSGGAPPAGGQYLAALTPTVDYGGAQNGPQTISNQAYDNSVTFTCSGSPTTPTEAYDVSGYHTFTALVGVADNTQNAVGIDGTVAFTDQDNRQIGKAVTVSLGNPAKVTLNITGVTQLGVTCIGRDRTSQSGSFLPVVLGDAAVS